MSPVFTSYEDVLACGWEEAEKSEFLQMVCSSAWCCTYLHLRAARTSSSSQLPPVIGNRT